MSILEFPEAIASAFTAIGNFFGKIYWWFYTLGWALSFIFFVVAFFGIQLFFIYFYYRVILLFLSMRPTFQKILNVLDRLFE
jgi:hypothetical protein